MIFEEDRTLSLLRRILSAAQGRPPAALFMGLFLALSLLSEWPATWPAMPQPFKSFTETLSAPVRAARLAVFDTYQSLSPRNRQFQPVTIVAIDEKSLRAQGQWPWPRKQLAQLIKAVNAHQPAAIGLDIYMPEADRTSPEKMANLLPSDRADLATQLRQLPRHDDVLASALFESPSVLGAAGFDVKAYTTTEGLRTVPLTVRGPDPRSWVQHYPQVLASLPVLQAAASGQALLSVDTSSNKVRKIPLLGAVGEQLVPGLALEMFRVATGSESIIVNTSRTGISSFEVADLKVPTEAAGDIWLHSARLADGMKRYISAQDIFSGAFDPTLLRGKLVLIGLTGEGLNDMRLTSLRETVPGVEIQAQVIEALFERSFLRRPMWLKWLELGTVVVFGGILIWFAIRSDSRIAAWFNAQPVAASILILCLNGLFLALGFVLFIHSGLLLDASSWVIAQTLIMGALMAGSMTISLGRARYRLSKLVNNGILLGQAKNRDKLLRQTIDAAADIANCAEAVLYLKTENGTLVATARYAQNAINLDPSSLPSIDLDSGGPCPEKEVLSSGKTLNVNDLKERPFLSLTSRRDVRQSILYVPMKPHDEEVIGLMILRNPMESRTHQVIAFNPLTIQFAEALAAQAAVAIENQNLLEAQKQLMDALIKLVAGAIDAKSPYTGGHCDRVPELALMLAEAATDQDSGPLANFRFETEEEWREFRVGAWLHDCGKVTTPEYVVDKAVKLETIYNRIHEVRMRFEVLLRDAQISALETVVAGTDAQTAQADFESRKAQLIDDFTFIAECNEGTEFMAAEKVDRLKAISQSTWVRHFDNRVGLSNDEFKRYASEPDTLPTVEQLLADKQHHVIERPQSTVTDAKWGFKVDVPEHLYNHGEVYNLSIAKGTLTNEERYKINEHVMHSLVMLEQLPLPKNLRRVPEYAGTHHETLAGTGYPRKLDQSQLTVPMRIMAIADIFEALTASDRPYKKAKTLSESVKILSFFKKDGHIDAELFDLFLTSGVYKQYAEKFLLPDQIDAIDIAQYLG